MAEVLGHNRVFPDQIAQKQKLWPCTVYQMQNRDDGQALASKSRLRVVTYTVEIYCPDSKDQSRREAAAEREKITEAFAGPNCRGDWSGIFVTGAVTENPVADANPIALANEQWDRIERFSVRVNYRQPDPA
jgi:hypothetical protein